MSDSSQRSSAEFLPARPLLCSASRLVAAVGAVVGMILLVYIFSTSRRQRIRFFASWN